MTIQQPTAAAYVESINHHDRAAFNGFFAEDATVDDVGRMFRGADAIKAWSDREIFDAQVTVEVIDAAERDGLTVLMSKVDGNFDRTGLPDPLILEHGLRIKDNKIVALTCRLAGVSPA
jgi:SnoaL-like domain